jgi:hypothetical protein
MLLAVLDVPPPTVEQLRSRTKACTHTRQTHDGSDVNTRGGDSVRDRPTEGTRAPFMPTTTVNAVQKHSRHKAL